MSVEANVVNVNPPKVVFNNAQVGYRHIQTVSVQNSSSLSRNIRFRGPATDIFELSEVLRPAGGHTVAPGLEVTAEISYEPKSEVYHQDRVIVFVDDQATAEIPLMGIPPQPNLEVYGQHNYGPQLNLDVHALVNFGLVVADGQVLIENFIIRNTGTRSGDFSIAYTGNQPLKVIPMTGTIEPRDTVTIKVELIAQNPGEHVEELNISLEGAPLTTWYLYAQIVNRRLMLFTGDATHVLQHIAFGPTYYGSDLEQAAFLRNSSPCPMNFVAVLEEGAAGEEPGVDLTRAGTATLVTEYGSPNSLPSLVTMHPNQGTIGPYQKIPVTFKFSPRFTPSPCGWNHNQEVAARRDYALFMHIEPLGVDTDTSVRAGDDPRVEVAVTGTALPVQVSVLPDKTFEFGECATGDTISILTTIQNDSPLLPAAFSVNRVAHFKAKPSHGVVSPGQRADLLLTFCPTQMGHLKNKLHIDVHGVRHRPRHGPSPVTPIVSIPLSLTGRCTQIQQKSKTLEKKGDRQTTNVRLVNIAVTDNEVARFSPRATTCQLSHSPTHVQVPGLDHTQDSSRTPKSEPVIHTACPDDLASSIRPHNRLETVKTPFTGIKRYTYIDSDYTHSPEKADTKKNHRQQYIDFIQSSYSDRKKSKVELEQNKIDRQVDLGMEPSSGLQPPVPNTKLSGRQKNSDTHHERQTRLLTSTQLVTSQSAAHSHLVGQGLNAVPVTLKEVEDCKQLLTPVQLRCVQINPVVVEFGQVCVHSVTTLPVYVANGLDQYIHIVAKVDCSELRQSSPLSQVIPPYTTAKLPLVFESHRMGSFQRSVQYTINGHHSSHVIIQADIVSVGLHVSRYKTIFQPQIGRQPDATYQEVVVLENKRNLAAEFVWVESNLGDLDEPQGFVVHPTHGIVEPHKKLCCLVIYRPTFDSPVEGNIVAQVKDGNRLPVRCQVDFGSPVCGFKDRRLLFGAIPLALPTTRTTIIENTGAHHAFFKVTNPSPYSGMTITPTTGNIPVGGSVQLRVELNPQVTGKFDTWIHVNIRQSKRISLRVAGSVEMPSVDVNMDVFQFGGVFCGSQARQKFQLRNHSSVRAQVCIDLSQYRDFALQLPRRDVQLEGNYVNSERNVYMCSLSANETAKCQLIFMPDEVAAYDFVLPVTVNNIEPPPAPRSPWPPSPTQSRQGILSDKELRREERRGEETKGPTPKRRVLATALSSRLEVDKTSLEVTVPAGYLNMGIASPYINAEGIELTNISKETLSWSFDLSQGGEAFEKGVFRFIQKNTMCSLPSLEASRPQRVGKTLEPGESLKVGLAFCPDAPGQYKASIPLLLGGDSSHPYRMIELHGSLASSCLVFDPPRIALVPVPLGIRTAAEFTVKGTGFHKETELMVSVPDLSDLTTDKQAVQLKINFLSGDRVRPCQDDTPCELRCRLEFVSIEPVSYSGNVTFSDNEGNIYLLPISVGADNCILTVYSYLAAQRQCYQIIREPPTPQQQDTDSGTGQATRHPTSLHYYCPSGEAVLRPISLSEAVSSTQPSTIASGSQFALESCAVSGRGTFTRSSLPSSTPSSLLKTTTPRDGARNLPGGPTGKAVISDIEITSDQPQTDTFVAADLSEEQWFLIDVLGAVKRWFSCHGWPGRYHPVDIPDSLRSSLTCDGVHQPSKGDEAVRAGRWRPASSKKPVWTIFDCVAHLCGSPIPGIPINSPLPSDPTERAKHVHWLYTTLITFLKSQGARLSSVEPDMLLAFEDFRRWHLLKLQMSGRREPREKQQEEREEQNIRAQFDLLSTQAWTDLLLQTLKVFVLSRVTTCPAPMPPFSASVQVDVSPLRSNIYGTAERVLLEWLNRLYEDQRKRLFAHLPEGEQPVTRWIVNFDVDLIDGLVIGTCLAAYTPFLIDSHLKEMYARPSISEECLHNALLVVEALRALDFEYDIQAHDFLLPNPVCTLLFCCFLYTHLPSYLPKSTIKFEAGLSSAIQRQVQLTNPTKKPIYYSAKVLGPGAECFSFPKGNSIQVSPQKSVFVPVNYISHSLNVKNATLLFTGHRGTGAHGRTLVFELAASVNQVNPTATLTCQSVLYERCWIDVEVTNPFHVPGDFTIILVEEKKTVQDLYTELLSKSKSKSTTQAAHATTEALKKELSPAFFASQQNIFLEAQGTGRLHIVFLPVHLTKRRCSLLFSCSFVGEFVYSIEGDVTLPRPHRLPLSPLSSRSVRISSAAQAGRARAGIMSASETVSVWQCHTDDELQEELIIPAVNSARDQALIQVTQLGMSMKEAERRRLTGTLAAAAITKSFAGISLHSQDTGPDSAIPITVFHVTSSSKYFRTLDRLVIPALPDSPRRTAGQSEGSAPLQIHFKTNVAGHYPCQIVLWSPHDIRVFHIECIVSQGGVQAELEFTSPALSQVTQNIPLTNTTSFDWQLESHLMGDGFSGPPTVLVKALTTSYYPLQFRPIEEGNVEGLLILRNTVDGCDYGHYKLCGIGKAPSALEHITINCQARKQTTHTLRVPNSTKHDLTLKVFSGFPFIGGDSCISVPAGGCGSYQLSLLPLCQGQFSGPVRFSVDENNRSISGARNYLVWYNVEVIAELPDPENTINLRCNALEAVSVDIPLTNCGKDEVTYKAVLEGPGLSGPSAIRLAAQSQETYQLMYSPQVAGTASGKLILENIQTSDELWYDLRLMADPPKQQHLPTMQCELAKTAIQSIHLFNPLDELLVLTSRVSSLANFRLHTKTDGTVLIPPQSSVDVPIEFTPSSIGDAKQSEIIFSSKQLGDWSFLVNGIGLSPRSRQVHYIRAPVGFNSTSVVKFCNPLDHTIHIDTRLRPEQPDKEDERLLTPPRRNDLSKFCLSLAQHIVVEPRQVFDIPVSFAPDSMHVEHAELVVSASRPDGKPWDAVWVEAARRADSDVAQGQISSGRSEVNLSDDMNHLHWVYRMCGLPEMSAFKPTQGPLLQCPSRQRLEERLEVCLITCPPSSDNYIAAIARPITPATKQQWQQQLPLETPASTSEFAESEYSVVSQQYTYRIVSGTHGYEENSVGVNLVRQRYDPNAKAIALLFNVVFAPYKPLKHVVQLEVFSAEGGMWRFPIRLHATQTRADDTLVIEAVGLNKEACVGFRLNSQAQHPVPYKAFFSQDSDPEFTVHPRSGELMPVSNNGTLIQVSYCPQVYGKPHQARLVIQTETMQWTYDIIGKLPDYWPPYGVKPVSPTRWNEDPIIRKPPRNFVRDNLEIMHTGISSSLKGAPLLVFPTRK